MFLIMEYRCGVLVTSPMQCVPLTTKNNDKQIKLFATKNIPLSPKNSGKQRKHLAKSSHASTFTTTDGSIAVHLTL